jgi:hypothetical protein
MSIVLPTLAVAFAAFCVWLGVRVYNRRERWAKWTLAAAIGIPALYVASFGPACWVSSRMNTETEAPVISSFYRPVTWTFSEPRFTARPPPGKLEMALRYYAGLFAKPGWRWFAVARYDLGTDGPGFSPWEWMKPPGPLPASGAR